MMFQLFNWNEFIEELNIFDTAIREHIAEDGNDSIRRAFPCVKKSDLLGSFSPSNSYFLYLADFQSGGITYKYIAAVTITYLQAKYLVYYNKGGGSHRYFHRTKSRYRNAIKNLVLLIEHPLRNENFLEMLTDRVMETPMIASMNLPPQARDAMFQAISDYFRNNDTFARYDATGGLYRAGVLPAFFGLHMSKAEEPHGEGRKLVNLKPFVFELNEALARVHRGKPHGNNENHKVVAAR